MFSESCAVSLVKMFCAVRAESLSRTHAMRRLTLYVHPEKRAPS
jgi:hypothetical protein